jgi:hypothetical protein
MQANLLHVVTAIANPLRWESRLRLYRQFEWHMLESGVQLTTVEVAYGDRPFACAGTPGVNHVGLRSRTMIWNKESALNAGIGRLPQDWKYVAWVDADVIFRRHDWAAEMVEALQLYDVVQPWTHCYDLGPAGEHLQVHTAFAWLVQQGRPIRPTGGAGYEFGHPGYAWAATRGALEHVGGLIEGAMGAGDHHMALALIGRVRESVPGDAHPGYVAPLVRWQERAQRHIGGNLGVVPGTIEHLWHGPKAARGYVSRWGILTKHGFDPATDLKRNVWGLPELAGNKPELRRDIERYFRSRVEDSNAVG